MNVLIIISCICFLFIIGRIFIIPIKWIFKLLINSIFGGILILIINFIGLNWGFRIGINFITILLVRSFRSTRRNIYYVVKISHKIKTEENGFYHLLWLWYSRA